ncbi:hypothetical protein BDR07DRAFT_1487777 [Suillus spraguei]|nr:hypothetical protein BDR07DRAFT_1487777 [Suillus spraguei]
MLLPQPTTLYLLCITLRCPGLAMPDTPLNTPFLKPDYTPFCSNGHGELQWKVIVSNAKGNQGHWMVSCLFTEPEGKCSHFQWGSHSPPSSPNLLLSPVLLLPPPALPLPPPPPPAMCRKHCWAVGGCDAKGHTVSRLVQATLAPVRPSLLVIDLVLIQASLPGPSTTSSSSSNASSLSFPSANSTSTMPPFNTVSLQSTTVVPAASKNKGKHCATALVSEGDFYANPKYPFQLPLVFTNAYAMQEEERLHRHQAETLEHKLTVATQNTVMVFGWAVDDEVPTICEFQGGFVLHMLR